MYKRQNSTVEKSARVQERKWRAVPRGHSKLIKDQDPRIRSRAGQDKINVHTYCNAFGELQRQEILKLPKTEPGLVAHTCNLNTWETEAGG